MTDMEVLAVAQMTIGHIINLFLNLSLGRVGYEKRDDYNGVMSMIDWGYSTCSDGVEFGVISGMSYGCI
jgi:hypothetical protein